MIAPPSSLRRWLLVAAGVLTSRAFGAEIVDDAGRHVELTTKVSRVFAAGYPAEILLYTLAPEMLAGRNHPPPAAALELIPPEYRKLPTIGTLPERDEPRYDAELVAAKPDL